MDVRFSLAMPREAYTVPVVRRFIGDALRAMGVADDCLDDLLLAGAEACSNVLEHGGPARRYEVEARIGEGLCVLEILDEGEGFDVGQVPTPKPDSESGRGILLMRELVDEVSFVNRPDRGTVVCLQKRLAWRNGTPAGSSALLASGSA